MEVKLKNINRILIINLAFIGDVLLSTPVSRALRQAYPDARIDMLVIPVAQGIAELNPYIDNVYVYDKKGKHRKTRELFALIADLRRQKYDLAISTNFALRGAMVAWAVGARYRIGYNAQHAKWFLTHTASTVRSEIKHESEYQLAVLNPLGISTEDTRLVVNIRKSDRISVQAKLKRRQDHPLVLICPAGSYQRKSWTMEGYAELIRELVGEADCCLIGGRAEGSQLADINQASGELAQAFPGTLSLGELAALVEQADVLVTVDTAPLHIAQAVDTPVVALFGPTDPRTWGPRGSADKIIYKPTACSPCWGKGDCYCNECMQVIKVSEVIDAVRSILKGRKDG